VLPVVERRNALLFYSAIYEGFEYSPNVIFRHDKALYRERNRSERCFNKLKHFRRLATRYDRRACHFLAFLCLAGAMLWMR
jgi:transposase